MTSADVPKDLRWLDGLDNELIVRIVSAEARIRELEQALEKIRDYPHGTDNCCPMSEIAYAALHVADKAAKS